MRPFHCAPRCAPGTGTTQSQSAPALQLGSAGSVPHPPRTPLLSLQTAPATPPRKKLAPPPNRQPPREIAFVSRSPKPRQSSRRNRRLPPARALRVKFPFRAKPGHVSLLLAGFYRTGPKTLNRTSPPPQQASQNTKTTPPTHQFFILS